VDEQLKQLHLALKSHLISLSIKLSSDHSIIEDLVILLCIIQIQRFSEEPEVLSHPVVDFASSSLSASHQISTRTISPTISIFLK